MAGTDGAPVATARPAGDDHLARWPFWRANAPRWRPARTWAADDAALVHVPRDGRGMLVGLGEPAALAPLLAAADVPPVGHVMLTRGTWDLVPAAARERLGYRPGRPWEWMAATEPPARRAGEEHVAEVTGADRLARVHACLAEAYPERGAHPGDEAESWWGYTADGHLAGVAAASVPHEADRARGAGVHLQAVAVVPAHRRRGVAAAMTAALTRWGLALGPVVHLGIWSDNDAARRVYERLGFVTAHRIENLGPRP
ncbi:GNAT family N-acetyltransferase [Georgenia sp. AZ-5]|uniref:GNAT family N-acetyltransferase n=1 Tax=Georgenia sp. AZ-5 TaxID=3367526 RepID=UPI0037546661